MERGGWLGWRTVSRGDSPPCGCGGVPHRPVAAWYAGMHRLLCTHAVGYNEPGEWRVFCYLSGGETKSGPLPGGDEGIWRCFSLIQLCGVELLESPWRTEPHAPQHG